MMPFLQISHKKWLDDTPLGRLNYEHLCSVCTVVLAKNKQNRILNKNILGVFTDPADVFGYISASNKGVNGQERGTNMKLLRDACYCVRALLLYASLFHVGFSVAMSDMSDSQMSSVDGEGVVFGLENFSFAMAPTSYIQLIGSPPTSAAAANGWQRGDLYLYGFSLTGAGAGTSWYGPGCSTAGAAGDLGCPLGTGTIKDFASVYNPFILRAFQYPGFDYQGNSTSPTVMELQGPTQSDPFRMSYWGEMQINQGATLSPTNTCGTSYSCFLQSQMIFEGKLIATDAAGTALPTVVRLMQTTDTNANDASSGYYLSLGMTLDLALSGNFRFSVAQNSDSPNALHQVPDFNDQEGVFIKNFNAYLPMGMLDYQNIVFASAPAHDGNFSIELMQIPNVATVYNNFYCGSSLTSGGACATNADGSVANPNPLSHGFIQMGTPLSNGSVDMTTTGTSTSNGLYFQSPSGAVTNLGTVQINGLLIQHLKMTTTGA